MRLTERELRFFETFGYLHMPQLLTPEEVEWITEEFEYAIRTFAGGGNHDGTNRLMFIGPIDRTPKLCTLLDNDRIAGMIKSVLGDDFNYASGDGNYYTGDTAWHPDGAWGQIFACKVAIYLDPVGKDSGCLRVIPGSQSPDHFVRAGQIDPNRAMELFGVEPRDFPGNAPLESRPGDVVFFNHDLFHASYGGSSRRRMFTMNVTRKAHTPAELELVRRYVGAHSPAAHKLSVGGGMYSRLMLETAGDERKVHLEQMAPIYDELFPEDAAHST